MGTEHKKLPVVVYLKRFPCLMLLLLKIGCSSSSETWGSFCTEGALLTVVAIHIQELRKVFKELAAAMAEEEQLFSGCHNATS